VWCEVMHVWEDLKFLVLVMLLGVNWETYSSWFLDSDDTGCEMMMKVLRKNEKGGIGNFGG